MPLQDNVVQAWQVRDRLIARRYSEGLVLNAAQADEAADAWRRIIAFGDRTFAVCEALQNGEHLHALNLACSIPGAFELAAVIGSAFLPDRWEDGSPVEANPW